MTQGELRFSFAPQDTAERHRDAFSADSCARPGCDMDVPPQTRGGDPKRYCSQECQRQHWDDTHPRIQAATKKDAGPTRAELILARLKKGPATGLELLKAGGGTRYGARLLELRQRGYQITTDMGGEWPVYRLGE